MLTELKQLGGEQPFFEFAANEEAALLQAAMPHLNSNPRKDLRGLAGSNVDKRPLLLEDRQAKAQAARGAIKNFPLHNSPMTVPNQHGNGVAFASSCAAAVLMAVQDLLGEHVSHLRRFLG